MFWKNRSKTTDEPGPLEREIVRAAAMNDEEADAAAGSPFLYSRIRARIAAEQTRRADPINGWFATMFAAWRAIPAMSIIAIAAAATFWFAGAGEPRVNNPNVPMPEMGTGGIAPVQACAISDNAGCNVSTDEVIAALFNEEGQEAK